MQSDTFEKAFSNYLAHKDYDEAEDALFSTIRAAFLAGWHDAGGKPPEPSSNLIYLLHKPTE